MLALTDPNGAELFPPGETFLAEKAGAIRALVKNVARDIVEIGRHLTEAKAQCNHGEWLPWLESEFAWSRQTADNFMNVYEMTKMPNFGTLPDFPISSLYALAAPSTPEPIRQEVIARAEEGEKFTRAQIDDLIAEAKRDAQRAAVAEKEKAIAAATGELFLRNEELSRKIEAAEAQKAAALKTEAAKAQEEKTAALAEQAREAEAVLTQARAAVDAAQAEAAEAKANESKIAEDARAAVVEAAARAEAAAMKALEGIKQQMADLEANNEDLRQQHRDALDKAEKTRRMTTQEIAQMRKEVALGGDVRHFLSSTAELLKTVPAPGEAVARVRKQFAHTVCVSDARAIGEWFLAFAAEWENTNGR